MQVDSSLVFGRQACLRQLASLVRIAADLFADFEAEAVAVDRRTRRLSERLLRLQLVVDAVDSASITVRKSRSISSAVRLLDWMSLDPVLAALHPILLLQPERSLLVKKKDKKEKVNIPSFVSMQRISMAS